MPDKHSNWDAVRHEQVADELAAMFGLPVTPALAAFYRAAYATAVYDVADNMPPGATRETVIKMFAPPPQAEAASAPPAGKPPRP